MARGVDAHGEGIRDQQFVALRAEFCEADHFGDLLGSARVEIARGSGIFIAATTLTFSGSLVGAIWAFFDGLIGGAIFAWLYDLLGERVTHAHRMAA
jgi:hypothetical protein